MFMFKEINCMIIDGLFDYFFIVGMVVNCNLNQIGMENEIVYYVGNILIDMICYNCNCLIKLVWFFVLGLKEYEYILLIFNCYVLLNNKENLQELMEILFKKVNGMFIVVLLYIYVCDVIKVLGIIVFNLYIMFIQSYFFFGYLMNQVKVIVIDLGNVVEEVIFLGIFCIMFNMFVEYLEIW